MKVLIAYTVVSHGTRTAEFLERFRLTYDDFPAGYPCDLVCVCNGGPPDIEEAVWFRSEWKCYPRKNEGGDLGAYFDISRNMDCDLLVCLGESVFFHRRDWLLPLVKAWENEPGGMYGAYASNLVTKHLNTTFFAVDPRLLRSQPVPRTRSERHEWEHGQHRFMEIVCKMCRPIRLVTFSGVYGMNEWRATQNAFWQNDQSDCLAHCIHTERFKNASEATKRLWTRNADSVK